MRALSNDIDRSRFALLFANINDLLMSFSLNGKRGRLNP